jgi:preprotein translocase subunit SecG
MICYDTTQLFLEVETMAAIIKTILTVIFALDSIALVIVIMMQKSKDTGLGAIGGMSISDTYWGRNKGRSAEGNLVRLTRVLAVIFVIDALVLNIHF